MSISLPGRPLVGTTRGKLAIHQFRDLEHHDESTVDAFLHEREVPIVEGSKCTFLFRGEADEVHLLHRIVNQPQRVPLRRIEGTSLWYVVIELPYGSRVEYQLELSNNGDTVQGNDPLNPTVAHSPVGSSSVCQAVGYVRPEWTQHDPEARPGELHDLTLPSKALRRETHSRVYLPARFRQSTRYPLLIVHDGDDYLNYSSMKTVLDNLIHNLDMAETIVVFSNPGDRMREYPNYAPHARHLVTELIPHLEEHYPIMAGREGRALMGASFGAIAAMSTAYRNPDLFGSLLLQSGSFVFTDIGDDHGGGPAFDPVVKFMNRYRSRPRRLADRMFVSCGVYEPLIVPNRSMVPVWESTGSTVRYVEVRDGHSWENWRDRLRDGLSWTFPGPQKFVYE